ncbi:MAG: phosphate ABC transporter permease PstA [Verrucomicrobium sp.]|nr:phosphate ABC transporter permease PstA [Verrucomicrobium sp.]
MVWLSSVGLSIGLLMIATLLTIIVVNGLEVFWPKRVVQVQISDASGAQLAHAKTVAGEITKQQEKTHEAKPGGGPAPTEWQLYVGNKDAYGLSFLYLNRDAITGTAYPKDLLKMERVEYGNALGYPLRLQTADGATIEANDPAFRSRLAALNREANSRRHQIAHIERDEIGKVNARMGGLKLDEKGLASDSPQFQALQAKMDKLQAKYEILAKQAGDLRQRQGQDRLTYRLPTGAEKTMPLGQLVSFYYPNQLGLLDRLGWFFYRIWHFLVDEPREANTEGGVFPAIFGTCVMTVLMSVAVMPFGVLAAIYLREYARQGFFVRAVRVAVNNLAGVPSIVFGVFGLGFFVYMVGGTMDQIFFSKSLPTPTFGTGGVLWAALTLALMTVPVVIVATEEALAAVPRGMREGSLACGASKWQTIQHIVLPSALPGILTGLILAMARGAGEVAPLMMVGVVKLAPSLPIDATFPYVHLERKFMHLGFHIYDLGFQSPDSEAAKPMVFATTLLLIILVVALNLGAILLRERIRRKYRLGAF